jgi:uncharacterized protein (DUF111 family)
MLLLVNTDDVYCEAIPHIIDGLMTRGAKSVHVVQAITKKGRPEFLFFIDAPAEQVDALAVYLAGEIGTLGVRVLDPRHICFDYRFRPVQLTARAPQGPVTATIRIKEILDEKGKLLSVKAESDDVHEALVHFQQAGLPTSFVALKSLAEQTALKDSCHALQAIEAVCLPAEEE